MRTDLLTTTLLFCLFGFSLSTLASGKQTKYPITGEVLGTDIQAIGKTTASYRRNHQLAGQDNGLMAIDGMASVDWRDVQKGIVPFSIKLNLGTHKVDVKARLSLVNFKSIQSFFGLVQIIEGQGRWDPNTRTLTYKKSIDLTTDTGRNSGIASKAIMEQPPRCEKPTSRMCKAFFKTNQEAEGIDVRLVFNDDKSSLSGEVVIIQHNGSGLNKSTAFTTVRVRH